MCSYQRVKEEKKLQNVWVSKCPRGKMCSRQYVWVTTSVEWQKFWSGKMSGWQKNRGGKMSNFKWGGKMSGWQNVWVAKCLGVK